MNKTLITYCCRDCGKQICRQTALQGKGRCPKCKGIYHSGNKSWVWKGGWNNNLPECVDCNTKLSGVDHTRCKKCSGKFHSGKSHHNFGMKLLGNKNPNYGNGEKIRGNKNPNWIDGRSYKGYDINLFNNSLKLKIRTRDGFLCKCCGISEEKHLKLLNRKLTIHHIDYNKFNCEKNNLITTCVKCNSCANKNRDYWFAYYTYIMENRT